MTTNDDLWDMVENPRSIEGVEAATRLVSLCALCGIWPSAAEGICGPCIRFCYDPPHTRDVIVRPCPDCGAPIVNRCTSPACWAGDSRHFPIR